MIGMHAQTGQAITGIDHLRQSVMDILTTPLGSRLMRPDYGSTLFTFLDSPLTHTVGLYAAIAQALQQWEPRLKLHKVEHHRNDQGQLHLRLSGEYLPNGQTITLDGLVL